MASPRAHGVRRLEALVLAAREPIFLIDPHGALAFVNPAWEALTGLSAEAVLGRPASEAVPPPAEADSPSGPPPFVPPPEAIDGLAARTRALIVTPSGDRLWRRIEFLPQRDADGAPLGILGLVREEADPPITPDSAAMRPASELQELREALRRRHGHASLVGRGPRHERLLGQVAAAALTASPAILVGEPGTGRRQVARVIHERSASGGTGPFLVLDLAALDPEAQQRELFGSSGDLTSERLAAPEGSTLLIDDLARAPRDVQARLVPALRGSGVRVLGAMTSEPEAALRDGRFREDFYYAMSVLVLRLPPLRERLEELPLLAQHFLERANIRGPQRRTSFTPEALEALASYDWPGNLGELARVVDAAHARASGPRIDVGDLPAEIRGELAGAYAPPPTPSAVTSLDAWLMLLERRLIEDALARARQNKSRAAELLDISRPRLYRRIKELNIPDEPEPTDEANGRGGVSAAEASLP